MSFFKRPFVAVLLSALVAGAAVSVVLVAACWCWLKLHE